MQNKKCAASIYNSLTYSYNSCSRNAKHEVDTVGLCGLHFRKYNQGKPVDIWTEGKGGYIQMVPEGQQKRYTINQFGEGMPWLSTVDREFQTEEWLKASDSRLDVLREFEQRILEWRKRREKKHRADMVKAKEIWEKCIHQINLETGMEKE